jgi:PAS domain-containing protein
MRKMTDSADKDATKEGFQWVLDKLPVGISVQTPNREILYENETVKELIGSYLHR